MCLYLAVCVDRYILIDSTDNYVLIGSIDR